MGAYKLSPKAIQDLEDIWRYTAEHWSKAQADRYLTSLFVGFEALEAGLGQDVSDLLPGYHKKNLGAHLALYRFEEEQLAIIVRVLHQRMDITARLSDC